MVHFFIGFVSKQGNGSVHALHRHPFYEIIITLKGRETVTVGDKQVSMREGSILIISPGVLHGGCFDGKYEEIYIQIDSLPRESI